jgi:hypothetical protein
MDYNLKYFTFDGNCRTVIAGKFEAMCVVRYTKFISDSSVGIATGYGLDD